MSEYVFGAHILESLTTGMYQDSRMIFREYIQNACDSIDKAVREGLLEPDEGRIEIELDAESRNITITDNAMGIRADDFVRVMGNIADSDKRIGEDRGFRGIGRLCGLAYCETVIFTAKFAGEDVVSRLTCNVKILRRLLDGIAQGEKHTASYVLNQMNDFTDERADDSDAHYFKVELIGARDDLLNIEGVRNYLSFAAPVPYQNSFMNYASRIHEHAKKLGLKINEYNIFLNGERLFKRYTPKFRTRMGADEIFDLAFEDFRDSEGNITAWMWLGLSRFRGIIDKKCLMRGIRLRKKNVQAGTEDALQKLFAEDRGNYYFAGELFCVSEDLILNARRDYFTENPACIMFEEQVREYCKVLYDVYKSASETRSLLKRLDSASAKKEELNERLKSGLCVDDRDRARTENEIQTAREGIKKLKSKGWIIQKVVERNESERTRTHIQPDKPASIYSTGEQMLIRKIFGIITESFDQPTARAIIQTLKEKLS